MFNGIPSVYCVDKTDAAIKLNWSQMFALEILGDNDVATASKFAELHQVLALEILGSNKTDLALQLNWPQVIALESLGADNIEQVMQCE